MMERMFGFYAHDHMIERPFEHVKRLSARSVYLVAAAGERTLGLTPLEDPRRAVTAAVPIDWSSTVHSSDTHVR
jgi:hypothetical protein